MKKGDFSRLIKDIIFDLDGKNVSKVKIILDEVWKNIQNLDNKVSNGLPLIYDFNFAAHILNFGRGDALDA